MISFVIFFLLTAAAAAFGAVFTPGAWYAALEKPALTPPDWIFPVVWTPLYAMIAVAGWLLWRFRSRDALGTTAIAAWAAQLALNAAWSWLFFGLNRMGVALVEILVLWATILAVIVLSRRTSPAAGWLMAPYLAWVSFAAWLNFAFWKLNG